MDRKGGTALKQTEWTQEMDDRIYRLYANGNSYGIIGKSVGVSADAVKVRLRVIPRTKYPSVGSCKKCNIPYIVSGLYTYCIECGREA